MVTTTEKLQAAIEKLKNNKASRKDVIHAWLLKKMSVY
jgi:thymidylate synthase